MVKAGLIPALRQGAIANSENWFIVEMTPGSHPLEELEAVVAAMERGEQSLDESLASYERGIGLYRQCQSALEHAEQRVTQVNNSNPDQQTPFKASDAE